MTTGMAWYMTSDLLQELYGYSMSDGMDLLMTVYCIMTTGWVDLYL